MLMLILIIIITIEVVIKNNSKIIRHNIKVTDRLHIRSPWPEAFTHMLKPKARGALWLSARLTRLGFKAIFRLLLAMSCLQES